jgi:hypothetical protein
MISRRVTGQIPMDELNHNLKEAVELLLAGVGKGVPLLDG